MKSYQAKMLYLYRHQRGCCAIAENDWMPIQELHHRLHNTKMNRKLYPLFIDSLWNLAGVSHKLHMENPSWGKISQLEAKHREAFLQKHPAICKALNMEGI